jgi:hypothetical protein
MSSQKMAPEEIQMHLAAGYFYGRENTCVGKRGKDKIRHSTEEQAASHASHHNAGLANLAVEHEVEAYPCYWSDGREEGVYHWHVGRKMPDAERALFTS